MKKRIQPNQIIQKKATNTPITMLTAYDYSQALILDEMGIDIVLVGDSLGNVFAGHENTLPVTMENMIYHTQAVARGSKNSLILADMPFLSYQISCEQAKTNAGRLIQDGGAQAVKIEVTNSSLNYIKDIIDMGIAVVGHIGFTPQSVYKLGGYKVQGKTEKESDMIINTAKRLEALGCFAIILEMVPANLAKIISEILTIPTIGIGAGSSCDGQVLVTNDLLGFSDKFTPKFVKKYANLNKTIKKAIREFKDEVEKKSFPGKEHSF
jgi:3-methyl-2-oxobutanoate hydroxymethyltransferase